MVWIAVIVFVGVFAIAAPLIALSSRQAPQARQDSAGSAANVPFIDFRKKVVFSAIPWMNRWLLKIELAPRLRTLLSQADLKWTVGGVFLMCAVCFAVPAYIVHLRTRNILAAVGIGLVLGLAPFAYVLMKRAQRFKKFEEGLPEALDLMVSSLRVGQSLHAALGLVARECPQPVGGEFRACFEEQNYGLELRGAMRNLTARVPLQDLRMVATGILIQKESGGNLAEVLEKIASVIRERFRIKRQIRVHTAQGRLTGWVLTCLPIGLGVVLFIMDPAMMSVLWMRPIGVKLLWAAAAMMVTGTIVIQKIIRMEV